jgi:hypothetical protein
MNEKTREKIILGILGTSSFFKGIDDRQVQSVETG